MCQEDLVFVTREGGSGCDDIVVGKTSLVSRPRISLLEPSARRMHVERPRATKKERISNQSMWRVRRPSRHRASCRSCNPPGAVLHFVRKVRDVCLSENLTAIHVCSVIICEHSELRQTGKEASNTNVHHGNTSSFQSQSKAKSSMVNKAFLQINSISFARFAETNTVTRLGSTWHCRSKAASSLGSSDGNVRLAYLYSDLLIRLGQAAIVEA